jgi:thioesterase domain-containing protein
MSDAPSASDVQKLVRATVPVLDAMGIEVVDAAPGRVHTRLPFLASNGNHIGTVYAGVLYSFLESSGGALVLMGFDVSRYIPIIVKATIRYLRPVTGTVDCVLSVTGTERDAVHSALENDPKYRWVLRASATDDEGRVACEADLVYRFRTIG